MTDDVKELLGRAFGQEPPLGIDRDEVIQQGRKRLRRKRVFEAGSVVALVVVAAVGAATLTGLADSEQEKKLPPAASSTQHAPPGPDLPMTTTTIPTTTGAPISLPPSPNEQQLTHLLYKSGIVFEDEAKPVPGYEGEPQFRKGHGEYEYEADVYRPHSSGYLRVTVGTSPGLRLDCTAVSPPHTECEIRNRNGTQVQLVYSQGARGELTTYAYALGVDGVLVTATVSNITRRDLKSGAEVPPGTPTVLSDDELCVLVTRSGLGG